MSLLNKAAIHEQLRIIAKTAEYGRNRAWYEKHSRNIDSFQHIQDEAERAMKWLDPEGEYGKQYV